MTSLFAAGALVALALPAEADMPLTIGSAAEPDGAPSACGMRDGDRLHVSGPALARAPLDTTINWQNGFRCPRTDLPAAMAKPARMAGDAGTHRAGMAHAGRGVAEKWFLHLGTTVCAGGSRTTAPSDCINPDRMTVPIRNALGLDDVGTEPERLLVIKTALGPAARERQVSGPDVSLRIDRLAWPDTPPGQVVFLAHGHSDPPAMIDSLRAEAAAAAAPGSAFVARSDACASTGVPGA